MAEESSDAPKSNSTAWTCNRESYTQLQNQDHCTTFMYNANAS